MNEQTNRCLSRICQLCLHSVFGINNCFLTGNKKERNLSAKRKDNAEVFIPSKPAPNLNAQALTMYSDQEKACSSKSSGGPQAGLVTLSGVL